ncbi:MAG: bacteriocin-protection protein, YdeI/OmpD-associated family [Candidatus Levybacteria bacterium RIFCSPHIGHO2_01_FULL_38_26]|nr:MAG: bacteriocin-protection protein, YdeI/OmpD-associated family [Candidatus Levybacteria bacterium RIFCSPHIGHO2_01_FULL_38_26]
MNRILDKKYKPIIYFKTQEEWEKWLSKNFDKSDGIWLKFYKKNSGIATVTYDQALDEALCFGWIDGQAKSFDEKSYLQRFTPRRSKSIWSKKNTEHITRLTKLGKMKPSGTKAVEAAKADGRWQKAYESPKNMTVPEDFLKELVKNKKAYDFFKTLNKTNTFTVSWQLHNAKRPETRERRMRKFIQMLERREKLY